MASVDIIYFKRATEIKLKKPTLIVCMPSPSLVPIVAGLYLTEKLNFEIIGYFSSDLFAPVISVHNSIAMPPVRIMANEKLNMIVVLSEIGLPLSATNKTADAILDLAKDFNVSEIGILLSTLEGEKGIYYIASKDYLKEKFHNLKINAFDEGAITGAGSLLYIKAQSSGFPTYALIAHQEQSLSDAKATEKLLKTIGKMYSFNIDTRELLLSEQEVIKAEEEIAKHDKENSMYE
ncbi:MAG: PAC2 family protein [Candidatus Anstonellales archaeon]